uniref:Secreted protein n=1 Tax=Photinus pyralis TaxID=7054 RepID=A0A1Y1MLK9_PHOPY
MYVALSTLFAFLVKFAAWATDLIYVVWRCGGGESRKKNNVSCVVKSGELYKKVVMNSYNTEIDYAFSIEALNCRSRISGKFVLNSRIRKFLESFRLYFA